jgi:hypothetical protein
MRLCVSGGHKLYQIFFIKNNISQLKLCAFEKKNFNKQLSNTLSEFSLHLLIYNEQFFKNYKLFSSFFLSKNFF